MMQVFLFFISSFDSLKNILKNWARDREPKHFQRILKQLSSPFAIARTSALIHMFFERGTKFFIGFDTYHGFHQLAIFEN